MYVSLLTPPHVVVHRYLLELHCPRPDSDPTTITCASSHLWQGCVCFLEKYIIYQRMRSGLLKDMWMVIWLRCQ